MENGFGVNVWMAHSVLSEEPKFVKQVKDNKKAQQAKARQSRRERLVQAILKLGQCWGDAIASGK